MEKQTNIVNGNEIRFKFSKTLAFLAGELSVCAKYFSTFANVSTGDYDDPKGTFGKGNEHKWEP